MVSCPCPPPGTKATPRTNGAVTGEIMPFPYQRRLGPFAKNLASPAVGQDGILPHILASHGVHKGRVAASKTSSSAVPWSRHRPQHSGTVGRALSSRHFRTRSRLPTGTGNNGDVDNGSCRGRHIFLPRHESDYRSRFLSMASWAMATKSGTSWAPRSSRFRRRTATLPSSISRSPMTSM
jgi:hypothetical protein